MTSSITYKHQANIGDIIAVMAGIKSIWEQMDSRAIFCQEVNFQVEYAKKAPHPTTHNGNKVTVNNSMFHMMKPLMLSQPYIEDFVEYSDQKIIVNLDVIRDKCFVNMPNLMIQSWTLLAFPDMACDLSQPWVDVEANDTIKNKVLINFTERYRIEWMDYKFLRKYEEHLIFSGTAYEHNLFCNLWGLNIPYLNVDDFLDLAKCAKGCAFFLGNQSFAWNLCNAIGVPRLLEMSPIAPNCQPFVGKDNFGFYHQNAAQYLFKRLFDKYIIH